MKKIISAVLSLLFVFGVVSCAKKNVGTAQTVTVIFDTNYKPIMSPLIAQFEKANPGIKVNAMYSGAVAAGSPVRDPDHACRGQYSLFRV